MVQQDAELVHAKDFSGATPLLCAALYGYVEVVWYLLDHGATIINRGHFRWTSLHWASCNSHAEVGLLVLQRGDV